MSEGTVKDRDQRILDAVLRLLARRGISGVSIRSVAREAGVGLGLVNYYFTDKTGLIGAALRRVEEQDVAIVEADPALPPADRLRRALRRAVSEPYLAPDYLALRLQLWSLAQAHPEFAEINVRAQARYREGLAALIGAALPELDPEQARHRAADVDVVQNGIWLSALLGLDRHALGRSVARCEEIAFGVPGDRPQRNSNR